MELATNLITGNKQYLRTCILYEVLKKKPIFDSYLKFCDTVGQDAMNYPDFEFWYYRFYHGNRNLDYDRSADPEPKTIMGIPDKSMTKIAEYLDPVERTFLRSMNHKIKTIADSFSPVFEKIEIEVTNLSLHWKLNGKRYSCFKSDNGCSFRRPNSSNVEKSEESLMNKGLKYLAPLMKIPNLQVNHFSLKVLKETPDRDVLPLIPFNAKNAFIHSHSKKKVVQYLSTMNPGHLESISLKIPSSREREHYEVILKPDRTIVETDQFKQAKFVEFESDWGFNIYHLKQFSHLKRFKCQVTYNVFDKVQMIRDIISTFEELESCELEFHGRWARFPMCEFAEKLGVDIPVGKLVQDEHHTITHRYQIPESEEYLEFEIKEEGKLCRINIRKIR
ncbi:hypothetical protein B9Z55_027035 [Caenorhabditis nigoni]|uniref:F-box domain-containing protein n=1 Tax=Caenorhabditis nigoni TaxID=1611254 RepID=A0A2G5SIH3_9PELO|nr:hypothetical protein B9Z55_027035 [Caenorhabditis nigoni]